jgi:hypothetical protein
VETVVLREDHPPSYLSPSRLECYQRCPALFRERYVLKVRRPPSVEMAFGTAVHKGIESHFKGEDHELAFLFEWRRASKELQATGSYVSQAFTARGLQLIDMVRALGLRGEPERRITMFSPRVGIPIIGYVDLWGDDILYDFKTSAFGWGPDRAAREIFQPAIYSQAYSEELWTGIPRFEFIVLPRSTDGPLQRFDATRSSAEIMAVLERTREIFHLIEAQQFACSKDCGKHFEEATAA